MTKLLSEIFSAGFLVSFFAGTIRLSTPILLAAVGDIFSQKSGILNLGLEGIMLMGALAGFAGAFFTGSLWLGILAAIVVGMIFSLIMAYLSISLKVNQVIAGIAITIFGGGLSAYLHRAIFGVQKLPPSIDPFTTIAIPVLSDIPFLGTIFFKHNILVYLAFIMVLVAEFVLNKTTFGLKVAAVGEHPHAADSKGINVNGVRYACMMIAGALSGVAGAFMSIGFMNTFIDQMVAGRGFIAVAVVIFSAWTPRKALIGALVFGGADALQMRLQAIGAPLPHQFLLALPYVLTIFVLISVSRRAQFPSAHGQPFERENR